MAFVSEDHRTEGFTHVLLITTGSVASIKAPLIVQDLLRVYLFILLIIQIFTRIFQYDKVKVQVVATKASLAFYDPAEVKASGSQVWTDQDEWTVRLRQSNSRNALKFPIRGLIQ